MPDRVMQHFMAPLIDLLKDMMTQLSQYWRAIFMNAIRQLTD